MKDFLMYETLTYQVFSKDPLVESGLGRMITDDGNLYEGQFLHRKPNGFGRLIYANDSK